MPTIPLQVIITAAKTVSRASVEVSLPPPSIRVRISATSITVTATASTSEPNGSPTRRATTSAWCTAASTAAARNRATTVSPTAPGCRPQVTRESQQGERWNDLGPAQAAGVWVGHGRSLLSDPLPLVTRVTRDAGPEGRVTVIVVPVPSLC